MLKSGGGRNFLKIYGSIIQKGQVSVDPDRLAAIRDMKLPDTVKELQKWLGMAAAVGRHAPRLGETAAPLYRMLAEARPTKSSRLRLNWQPETTTAARGVKKIIGDISVLTAFDSSKTLIINCDASEVGGGAVLSQDGKANAYVS